MKLRKKHDFSRNSAIKAKTGESQKMGKTSRKRKICFAKYDKDMNTFKFNKSGQRMEKREVTEKRP